MSCDLAKTHRNQPGGARRKPAVAGTRIPVDLVVELLAEDGSTEEILDQYPALTREDIRACLHYTRERLQSERVYPAKTSSPS